MHLFRRQGVRDAEAAAAADSSPVLRRRGGRTGASGAREACESVGFFHIRNHGVPDALVERPGAFTRVPLEEKLALRLNENNIGYLPVNASVQGASTVHKATRPNRNEGSFVSHDRAIPT